VIERHFVGFLLAGERRRELGRKRSDSDGILRFEAKRAYRNPPCFAAATARRLA
jgi:hypothetical protein